MPVQEVNKENPLAKRGPGRPPKVQPSSAPVEVESGAQIGDEDEVVLKGKELKAFRELLDKQKIASESTVVKQLVEALRESRKPYRNPADEENIRRQQDQMRRSYKTNQLKKEREQTYCQHMAGTNDLSDMPHPLNAFTAIIWHDVTNQLRWGICTVCQREFWPQDPDYRFWRSKRSLNRNSGAGERDGVDIKTWADEQHPEPFGTKTGVDPREVIQQRNALKF